MKGKDLMRAVGEVDGKYIKSAEKSYNRGKARVIGGRIFNVLKVVGAAALVLGVIVALWLPSVLFPRDPDPIAAGTDTVKAEPYTEPGTDTAKSEPYTEPAADTEITPPDDPDYRSLGGLTRTKDETEEFCAKLNKSGMFDRQVTKEECYQVTPGGFYEAVGAKLFEVKTGLEESDWFLYDQTWIFLFHVCGGADVELLSAVPYDPDGSSETGFLYTCTYGGAPEPYRTVFKYYDMYMQSSSYIAALYQYGAFIYPSDGDNFFDVYGLYEVSSKMPEKIGYIEAKDGGFNIKITDSKAALQFVGPKAADPAETENENADYVRYIERGNLLYVKKDAAEFLTALDLSGIKLDNVADHEIAQVTPYEFYRFTKAKLFIAGDRTFVYHDGGVREIGGGMSGILLSALDCDFGTDDITDIVYSYSEGSGLYRTFVEVYNMRTGEITRALTLYNCDAFLTYGNEAEVFNVYAAPHAEPTDKEFPEAKYPVGILDLYHTDIWTDIKGEYHFDLEYEEEKYQREHPDPAGYDLVTAADCAVNVKVNVRKVCRIPVGEGDRRVKCVKIPGDDFAPPNFGIDDRGKVYIVDMEQKKLEIFTQLGLYLDKIDLDIEGRKRLTFAVCSKGYIYAIYDQEALYRISENGEKTLITEGSLYQLEVSEKDGRVLIFLGGSYCYIDENCELQPDPDFLKIGADFDDKNHDMTTHVSYSCDGEHGEFDVRIDINNEKPVGMINGDLVTYVYDSEARGTVFNVYAPDGGLRCSIFQKILEGDCYSIKPFIIKDNMLYIMMCREKYTIINEITIILK